MEPAACSKRQGGDLFMKEKAGEKEKRGGKFLLISIVLVFCVLGTIVYAVSRRISREMSTAAIQNLSESLDLIQYTFEAILENEVEFQKLIAKEVALSDDPEEYIRAYEKNKTMVKMSFIPAGETEGVSNTGEPFSEKELDFSLGGTIEDMPVSQSYVNYMGAWAYTIKCPVEKDGEELGTLYVEYIYDTIESSLPDGFYNKQASLYVMDAGSERFILKPKGMGQRSAGHLNLDDFYRANDIRDEEIRSDVSQCLKEGKNLLFYHDIRGVSALNYMWALNGGTVFLVGYVPVEAIQQEGSTVNQNIILLIVAMLVAFFLCVLLYYMNWKQQDKLRKEQEQERKLHNEQLAEALKAAQAASNSKTMFLSNMSHDIRTPMNAVLGFANLLSMDAENPAKVREYTKKITASGQHLLRLINDVLDVSKIESGKVVLNYEAFTLSDVVASVEAIIVPMAKEKKQEFHVEVTGIRHEYLMGDETRINQVLINLLSNAVKYTQEGGHIRMRIIGLKQRTGQYEHIRIEVEDNGYGMTPEYLEVVFDAFTRAENSTTNKVQGTGLGMAITKNIIELMGGTIDVASEVGHGTIFTAELELRIPDVMSKEQFWQEHGIMKILTVDDEEQICRNIEMLMKDVGVHTDFAYSGKQAVEKVKQTLADGSCYDVILLDWNMPEMDGIETARQMRAITKQQIPILFLTAYDWDEIEEEAYAAGIDGFLAKPFFVSALKEKLQDIHAKREGKEKPPEEAVVSSLKGRHFLIAEDNEINSEILLELLHIDGADGEVAENGQLAVELFLATDAGHFDAVLMDVQMPVMNGYEATRCIRSMERADAKTIPIIAMTANAFAEDMKDAKDAGMNDHIAKPIDMEIIRKTLSRYL